MISGLIVLAGYLAAKKATDDLDAFQPGPPRMADLLVFAVSLVVLVVVDFALALISGADPFTVSCRPPSCIVVPVS